MKSFATIAIVATAVAGLFMSSPVAQAHGQDSCLDPTDPRSFAATIPARGSGTITTANGKPLCSDATLTIASYNVPDTWDKKGWNKTAIPQTLYTDKTFTFPAGKSNYTMSQSVATPDACKHTQVDFYIAPSYQIIDTLTADDGRNIAGVLFAATEKCKEPEVPKTPGVQIDKLVNGKDATKVAVKEVFTYTIKVTNNGEVALTNVVVTDPAPSGVTMLTTDKGAISDNALTYTIPSLKVGASVTITVTAKVAEYKAGNLVNTACVNAPEVNPSQPGQKDDCDDATVTVSKPDEPITPPTPEPEPKPEPETPITLPSTGIGDIASGVLGLSSLSGAGIYYLRSRRLF